MSGDRPIVPEEYWEAAHIFCNMLRRALAMAEAQKERVPAQRVMAAEPPAPLTSDQTITIVTQAEADLPIEREAAA